MNEITNNLKYYNKNIFNKKRVLVITDCTCINKSTELNLLLMKLLKNIDNKSIESDKINKKLIIYLTHINFISNYRTKYLL